MGVVWWIVYEVWTFDLLPIAIGLYAMSMLFHVDCMFFASLFGNKCGHLDDVFECSFLKYTAESEESRYCNGIQILWTEVCSRDLGLNWLNSLIWKRTFEPNSMKQHHIFVYLGLRWFSRPQYVSHFSRFPLAFAAMALFQAGSSDRMKLSEECTMISQILVSRLFAGRFPLSHEEQ